MEESYRKGVANHPDGEPCEGGGNAALEALDRGIGRLGIAKLRVPKSANQGADGVGQVGRQYCGVRQRECTADPAESKTPCMRRNFTCGNRETRPHPWPPGGGKQDFKGYSYGFRPGGSQQDAWDALYVTLTQRKDAVLGRHTHGRQAERYSAKAGKTEARPDCGPSTVLQTVVRGYFQYHAVPDNEERLKSFREDVLRMWLRQLRRRSQRSRWTWDRFQERLSIQGRNRVR